MARHFVYQRPGKRGHFEIIGGVAMGVRFGKQPVGRDELVSLARPRAVAPWATCIAELWRRGECVGPRRGLLLGERWDLGRGLFADLRREDLCVARLSSPRVLQADGADEEVHLEPGESKFLRAVLRAVRGTPRPARPRVNRVGCRHVRAR